MPVKSAVKSNLNSRYLFSSDMAAHVKKQVRCLHFRLGV